MSLANLQKQTIFFVVFHVFTIGLQKQPVPQNRKIRSRNENIGT